MDTAIIGSPPELAFAMVRLRGSRRLKRMGTALDLEENLALFGIAKGERLAMTDEVRVPIASEADILVARQQARSLAEKLGFWSIEQTFIAIAISEIALNIVQYAGKGEIILSIVHKDGTQGIFIVARDEGPGISDIELAMHDGYSTSGGPGLGLTGAKRLMDEFEIVSAAGQGTTVTMTKWLR